MKYTIVLPLVFAGLSAIGNAMFAFGQKRAEIADNPFLFLILTLAACITLFLATIPFLPGTNTVQYLSRNVTWVLISGVGFFLTFAGFYFLYTGFGTSYYVIYAVLAILTTSIIVGVFIFKESFNLYHALSVVCAIVTVVLFSWGQKVAQAS
ncbi:MAG: transporter [Proteobacteria bacterium]|nr:transporter [Pseudomonadota bacterium]